MSVIEQPAPHLEGEAVYHQVQRKFAPHFEQWLRCNSTQELQADPDYARLADEINAVLEYCDVGDFSRAAAPAKASYRVLAWNLERGIQYEAQLEALRTHPYLKTCDVLLLTETDLCMARSKNRAVAQEMARELGMHYAFVPCYLNLSKGSGVEYDADGENALGLHGNALLSRYPISRVRAIPLKNGIDKMAGREKRLGRQHVLATDIAFPNYSLTAVTMHLDTLSTQRHRRGQMRDILEALQTDLPVILGGDWNTTTYDASSAFMAIMGFWRRVFMGVENTISNHYLHPYRYFEKDLFKLLEARGFDYRQCNVLGERTTTYDVTCGKTRQNLGEWVPAWCFAFIRWALRNHGGVCPLKLDWFATKNVRTKNPVVIHDLREGRDVPLSDHDALGLDVRVP
ncbi:MAG: endonuclease/exonuclease/phosphatase family protein [Deltaproteobacteria bacterium]